MIVAKTREETGPLASVCKRAICEKGVTAMLPVVDPVVSASDTVTAMAVGAPSR